MFIVFYLLFYLMQKRDKQRRKDNPYLYEIVANERTGIDVDKMDYFSRWVVDL